MHPEISSWPSDYFYEGRLIDARPTNYMPQIHQGVRFIDIKGQQNRVGLSQQNEDEAQWILNDILRQTDVFRTYNLTIGIICMYSAQVQLVQRLCAERSLIGSSIIVGTVDGFQGGECDVLYISFVRSGHSGGIGFLDDPNRLNVAATRAKLSCTFVGDYTFLTDQSHHFGSLGTSLSQRRLVFRP